VFWQPLLIRQAGWLDAEKVTAYGEQNNRKGTVRYGINWYGELVPMRHKNECSEEKVAGQLVCGRWGMGW